jgi:serralysin
MAGVDIMAAAAGNDTYVVDNLGDTVTEGLDEGTDLVRSSVSFTLGSDVENLALTGKGANSGAGNDLANSITGNGAANSLSGGLGDDTLNGGASADKLTGGDGNDVYFIDNAKDAITELSGEGNDTASTSFTIDLNGVAFANIENVTLTGAGAIAATGNDGANLLKGNGAANVLNGGGGSDTLDGGFGVDKLTGGAGSDLFLRHALNEGRDIITDFQAGAGGDVLDISDLLIGFSSDNESQFVQCVQVSGSTTIRVDANGAAGGAAFLDVCVLSGQSVTLDALLADGNLVLG